MMYTVEEVRQEAIEAVKRWYIGAEIPPAHMSSDRAWGVLEHMAKMNPSHHTSKYFWKAGRKEEQAFMEEWDAWLKKVNG